MCLDVSGQNEMCLKCIFLCLGRIFLYLGNLVLPRYIQTHLDTLQIHMKNVSKTIINIHIYLLFFADICSVLFKSF